MSSDLTLSAASAFLSWFFTLLTWSQYRSRRKLHQLIWTVGIAFFALGVTIEAIAHSQSTWSDSGYRLWYFSGAMLGVAFLGQGTLHLLDRRDWTLRALEILIVISCVAGLVVLNAPINFSKLFMPFEPSGKAFMEISDAGWATPRLWTIPLNIYGTLWLVGGALYSSVTFWKKDRTRAIGTLLIAISGLVLASTSTLNRFGITYLESLGRLVGVSVLFAGFVITNLDVTKLPKLPVWPRVAPILVLALTGWAFAIVAFFQLKPDVWHVIQRFPGLFIIAAIIIILFFLVAIKLKQRTEHLID